MGSYPLFTPSFFVWLAAVLGQVALVGLGLFLGIHLTGRAHAVANLPESSGDHRVTLDFAPLATAFVPIGWSLLGCLAWTDLARRREVELYVGVAGYFTLSVATSVGAFLLARAKIAALEREAGARPIRAEPEETAP